MIILTNFYIICNCISSGRVVDISSDRVVASSRLTRGSVLTAGKALKSLLTPRWFKTETRLEIADILLIGTYSVNIYKTN